MSHIITTYNIWATTSITIRVVKVGLRLGYQEPSTIRKTDPLIPIPDPYRTLDCTPISSSTPGFSTPPFPNTPGMGHLYSPPSTIPPRQFAPFDDLLYGILQRAAGVSLHSGTPVAHPRSVSTLLTKGLRGFISIPPLPHGAYPP